MKTNLELLKQFSKLTGITDPEIDTYIQYTEGDWKPHKKQEEFHKSKKSHQATGKKTTDDLNDDRISNMLDRLLYNFKNDLNKATWPDGRGAAFGDDEEYYDAEWRVAEKPLMLSPHKEEKEDA